MKISNHPVIQHKLSLLRDKDTPMYLFRTLIHEISILLTYEASSSLAVKPKTIKTPLTSTNTSVLIQKQPIVIPILRAGLGMLDGFLSVFPHAKVGFIGMKRNETTYQSEHYYHNIPTDVEDRPVFLVDPMLATAGTATSAVNLLKQMKLENIHMINIIAAPEGIKHFQNEHPDVVLTIANIDEKLNQHAYILPGLGDAGDRLYGTE